MSDVMKVIKQVEAARKEFEDALAASDWTQAAKCYQRLQQDARDAYEPMRDHIGALHEAIADLQATDNDPGSGLGDYDDAVARLVALLPTDWAGETE